MFKKKEEEEERKRWDPVESAWVVSYVTPFLQKPHIPLASDDGGWRILGDPALWPQVLLGMGFVER